MASRFLNPLSRFKEFSRPYRRRYGPKAIAGYVTKAVSLRLARFQRSRSDALYIGITGSSGKSTTTALLSHILKAAGPVHAQIYENTLYQVAKTIRTAPPSTKFVVTEVGATVKGSISPMARLLRPDVAIITKVGLEHYSAFRGKAGVAEEKGMLVEALQASGLAVLNADDPHAMEVAKRCKATVVTFGRAKNADYRLLDAHARLPKTTLVVKVQCRKGTFEIKTPFVDEEFWLATLAAFATAVELGVDPERAILSTDDFVPPWNRSGLLAAPNGPTFIVDTVKAPNESLPATIAIIEKADVPHKRVVIGNISDYTSGPRKGYPLAYQLSTPFADQVIFVGEFGHRARATDADRQSGKFMDFLSPKEASDHIRRTARPDEMILLKGSQTQHLERLALNWTHDVQCWETNCGKYIDCLQCGMVEVPFKDHSKVRRGRRPGLRGFLRRLTTCG